jgi:hypothetical protein
MRRVKQVNDLLTQYVSHQDQGRLLHDHTISMHLVSEARGLAVVSIWCNTTFEFIEYQVPVAQLTQLNRISHLSNFNNVMATRWARTAGHVLDINPFNGAERSGSLSISQ